MINLDQSIAKVKEEVKSSLVVHVSPRETLIEAIMHEGAGRDRKTLLAWLNEQVELLPAEIDPVPKPGHAPVKPLGEGVVDFTPDAPISTPIYRPVRRGGIWCLLDVANNELRQERFDNKGDARAFIADLELYGDQIKEKSFHYSRSK